jgi:hypothetical protein
MDDNIDKREEATVGKRRITLHCSASSPTRRRDRASYESIQIRPKTKKNLN